MNFSLTLNAPSKEAVLGLATAQVEEAISPAALSAQDRDAIAVEVAGAVSMLPALHEGDEIVITMNGVIAGSADGDGVPPDVLGIGISVTAYVTA